MKYITFFYLFDYSDLVNNKISLQHELFHPVLSWNLPFL